MTLRSSYYDTAKFHSELNRDVEGRKVQSTSSSQQLQERDKQTHRQQIRDKLEASLQKRYSVFRQCKW